MMDIALTSETLLLGLLLTAFGLAGSVLSRRGRQRSLALLILFQGVAVACLAASAGIVGDIAAGCVLILGVIFSLTGGITESERDVP